MKDWIRYVKIMEWSDEDQSHVGSVPGLFGALSSKLSDGMASERLAPSFSRREHGWKHDRI